ncbi:MAG: DegT/DnrJ/EryC1/StrS family aminotransferase [Bacteroidia bacterium]|nr:DegT/DnrJ/EryC1/StrS family aminotransferase [Paludibacter sp.]NCB68922.1 DegT/DnrJ/EryC1/StrS family aminotransferase [Bacteroidia bacterium]
MINVTKTYLPDREKLNSYIDHIYSSGWLTNNGELLQKLEKQLSDYLGVEHLLMVSNGTLALQIAYKALGLSGEVITSPFSFVATTSTLVWENLTPVFADIEKDSFNIDPTNIESKITEKTSAILPVHVFGNACNVEEIDRIARKHNLKIIYDAAHAFGVSGMSKNVLNYGDASILSFHSTKIFHTIEGGAIIFKNKEDYEKAKLMINFGISGYDRVDMLGINSKMNEFQAAMGLCVLSEIKQIIDGREKVWNKYKVYFDARPEFKTQKRNNSFKNNYAYFPLVFENEDLLLKVKKELNEKDIFPRRYFYPSLNKLSYLEKYEPCEISESIASRILCLPLFPDLSPDIQEYICETITKHTTNDD